MSSNTQANKHKRQYLSPDSVNKISETFNSLVFYRAGVDKNEVIDKVKMIWKIEKARLLDKCQDHIVFEFERKLFDALAKKDLDGWVDTVNNSIDPYRRQADVGLSKAKRDIVNTWQDLSNSKIEDADIPWMRHLNLGENFAKFNDKNNRYIFTGFTNQAILGIAIDAKEKDFDSIVISKAELDKMLLHDFKVNYDISTPIGRQQKDYIDEKLGNHRSLTSIFVPQENNYWVREDGSTWKRKDGSKRPPTTFEADFHNLTKKTSIRYLSQPVWSVSSVSHLFDQSTQQKLESLRLIREMDTSYVDFSDIETLNEAVNQIIKAQIKDQSLHIMQRSNIAAYWPAKDKMAVPSENSFDNPVARYANWAKEIAKSTRHITGREAVNKHHTLAFMKEELMAQTVSFLLVKDLEEKLSKQHPETYQASWQAQFKAYYDSFEGSKSPKGSFVSFNEAYNKLATNKNAQSHLNEVMSNVLNAFQIVKTGRFHGREITAPERQSTLKGNFKSVDKVEMDKEKSDLTPAKVSIDASEMDQAQEQALDKAMQKLIKGFSDNKITNPERKLALNQIKAVLEDLDGHVQDRLLVLIKHTYKNAFDGPSPYDLDYNYYTEGALIDLYEELHNHLDKDSARFTNLIKKKASGDTLRMLDFYHGDNPQVLIDVAKAIAIYNENDISDMRVSASYSDESTLYKQITRLENQLEEFQDQIIATRDGIEKASQYMEVKKEKSNDSEAELS